MNPNIARLHPYPFEKLGKLFADVKPDSSKTHIALSIGEPKHAAPQFVLDELINRLPSISRYPLTKGTDGLRESITQWLIKRFKLENTGINANEHVLPVNGTREALFAFAQAMLDTSNTSNKALVLSPNPFYQIYEGAAILAGADIQFLNTVASSDFEPDLNEVDEQTWKRCQLIYLCSPGNPTGKVLSKEYLSRLLDLADKYDFIIASDECYSEIYSDEANPPPGLLEVAAETGRDDFRRCIVFHSLSKRSNLPGLRSGFVAGDKSIIETFLKYRTYHGCAMPMYTQYASIAAWNDELHVINNRAMYRTKFENVLKILKPVITVNAPDASFYLWPETPIDDQDFAKGLFEKENVTVLPGSFLSRTSNNTNPGQNRIRMALVADLDECIEAANRIKNFINNL
ncbi:MAG: succinyldiaminopimelate transaminase [Gammaproteobacteria bacterium]|nr:succinyldiaminopimelate transaminase [Gammaproteobacteria bacterium]